MNITQLIRPDLLNFNPYSSSKDEATAGSIWLNANESPFLSPLAKELVLNRYPDKQPFELIKQFSNLYQLNADQVILSRGSDEVIDLLTRLFCSPFQDAIMVCPPTFGMYAVCAQLQAAKVIEIPLQNNFQLDMQAILEKQTEAVKIIFLCSPNNPTGNSINKSDIFSLCQQFQGKSIIVVDEAYIEFSDNESLANYIHQYENLVVLRTLSKAYGLAGARGGLLLAQKEIVTWIKKIMAPYPISILSATIMQQLFNSNYLNHIQQQIACIKSERARLAKALSTIECVKTVWPSEANFLLIKTDDAEKIMKIAGKHGIVLRNMSNKSLLKNCVRISIGLPEENTALINVLKSIT